jgi:preprotein translocase subunit SecY
MLNSLINKKKKRNNPNQKILLTLILLFLFRVGNTIPLDNIDQEALKKSFFQLENKNAIMQIINMYSSGETSLLTPFSLGIIPFINASIIIDLFTALFPFLEKLQSEEGELGRKKLFFYKKILTLILAIIQSGFLIFYLKSYFYNTELLNLGLTMLEIVSGSMIIVWFCTLIDNKGIGNGTSLIILCNITVTLLNRSNLFFNEFKVSSFFEILIILGLMLLICISQTALINIPVVSARQLVFLENLEKRNVKNIITESFEFKKNGLAIKLNQAGIFPIIIASNLLPFLSYLSFGNKNFETISYYLLIVGFNYFYTIVFWDPEKISEQLRKASVSIVNVTPGKETVSYLENVVKSTSLLGGIFLCTILVIFEIVKKITKGYLLSQINISSLIIVVGVAYEIQKTIRSLSKNLET